MTTAGDGVAPRRVHRSELDRGGQCSVHQCAVRTNRAPPRYASMAGLPTVLWLQHYRNFRTDKLRGGLRSAPCDPELWVSSIAEALEQHRLTTKEEVRSENSVPFSWSCALTDDRVLAGPGGV